MTSPGLPTPLSLERIVFPSTWLAMALTTLALPITHNARTPAPLLMMLAAAVETLLWMLLAWHNTKAA